MLRKKFFFRCYFGEHIRCEFVEFQWRYSTFRICSNLFQCWLNIYFSFNKIANCEHEKKCVNSGRQLKQITKASEAILREKYGLLDIWYTYEFVLYAFDIVFWRLRRPQWKTLSGGEQSSERKKSLHLSFVLCMYTACSMAFSFKRYKSFYPIYWVIFLIGVRVYSTHCIRYVIENTSLFSCSYNATKCYIWYAKRRWLLFRFDDDFFSLFFYDFSHNNNKSNKKESTAHTKWKWHYLWPYPLCIHAQLIW